MEEGRIKPILCNRLLDFANIFGVILLLPVFQIFSFKLNACFHDGFHELVGGGGGDKDID